MHLTVREEERIQLWAAAEMARRRLERGVKLNYPETVALISDEILERAREAQATRIYIGSENRLFALSGSSVIASPFRDRDGNVVGVLGVIGPTRLNYGRIVPMVDFTAQSLGRLTG